jgi:O-antigen/teichoic acid export membrane protein
VEAVVFRHTYTLSQRLGWFTLSLGVVAGSGRTRIDGRSVCREDVGQTCRIRLKEHFIQRRPDAAATTTAPRESTITRWGALSVGAASGGSAVVGYVVLLLAARTLDQERNAEFLTFWALLFTAFGVMSGLSTEMTRAASVARTVESDVRHPRVGWFGLSAGAGGGVVMLVTGIWWGEPVFGTYAGTLVPLLAATVVLYAGHSILVGVLGGLQRWPQYSALITMDSVLRLACVLLAVAAGFQVAGLALASALGAGAWLLLLVIAQPVRRAWNLRADLPVRKLLRTTAHACIAAASSAALVVGFPVLLRLTTDSAEYLQAAALLLAISLTRAPVMIPLNAYQGVAITYFMANKARGLAAAAPIAGVIVLVSLVGAVAAWLVGPWLMVLLLGPGYEMSGFILGGLTFDAGLLAILTISGALCVSFHRHRAFSAGWMTATVVAIALLFLPLGIEEKAVIALLAGPLAGIVVHAVVLQRTAGRRVSSADSTEEGRQEL